MKELSQEQKRLKWEQSPIQPFHTFIHSTIINRFSNFLYLLILFFIDNSLYFRNFSLR